MKINIDFQIYPYGKVWDMSNRKESEKEKDKISIYTTLECFDKVPLSSIEGYFVVLHDEPIDVGGRDTDKFSSFIPQYTHKREKMFELEKKFNGKFYPIKSGKTRAERMNEHYSSDKQRFG
jgi:hypothetical protein